MAKKKASAAHFPKTITREDMEMRVNEWALLGYQITGLLWNSKPPGDWKKYPGDVDIHSLLCMDYIHVLVDPTRASSYRWREGAWNRSY